MAGKGSGGASFVKRKNKSQSPISRKLSSKCASASPARWAMQPMSAMLLRASP